MSIWESRSVRITHKRYGTKLNSTQNFHPLFPRTLLIRSWGEHKGEHLRTTLLYIPRIWCSLNDQENPTVGVRPTVSGQWHQAFSTVSETAIEASISQQPKRRVNHVHHRTRPDAKQGRYGSAIHPSLFQWTFRFVQVLVSTSSW